MLWRVVFGGPRHGTILKFVRASGQHCPPVLAFFLGDAMPEHIRIMLNEPSTWRGFVSVLTALGVGISPDQMQAVVAVGLAVSGAIGVFCKDKGAQ